MPSALAAPEILASIWNCKWFILMLYLKEYHMPVRSLLSSCMLVFMLFIAIQYKTTNAWYATCVEILIETALLNATFKTCLWNSQSYWLTICPQSSGNKNLDIKLFHNHCLPYSLLLPWYKGTHIDKVKNMATVHKEICISTLIIMSTTTCCTNPSFVWVMLKNVYRGESRLIIKDQLCMPLILLNTLCTCHFCTRLP